jgi:radical SAM protein with 4Fe4S-binding SPASM domain
MSFYKFNKILQHKDLNQLKNGYRKLIHVRIEPTEVCNFQCKFCVTQDPIRLDIIKKQGYDGGKRKFDLNRILGLLDELKEIGVTAISFVAVGDPLMYPNIDQVLKKAIKLNFALGLTSNFAMEIKDELFETLAKFKWLRWSMNGGSEEVYIKTNAPKIKNQDYAYKNVQKNIQRIIEKKKLLKSDVLVNASYVVSEWNFNDLENAAILGKKLEIDNLFFRPDMKPMDERLNQPLDILKINNNLLKKAQSYETDSFKVHIEEERENDVLKVKNEKLVCFYSNHSIYIAANGDVYPCCYTRINKKFVIGNINNLNFKDFWKKQENVNHYKTLSINTCPSCPYNNINEDLEKIYNGISFPKENITDKTIDPFV